MNKNILVAVFLIAFSLVGCNTQTGSIYNNTPANNPDKTAEFIQKKMKEAKLKRSAKVVNGDEVIAEPGAEVKQPPVVEVPLVKLGGPLATDAEDTETEYFFSNCGSRWQFKEKEWYPGFVDKLIKTPKLTTAQGRKIFLENKDFYQSLQEVGVEFGNISETNIAHICADTEERVALVMLNGDVQQGGGLVKYDIQTGRLAKAEVTSEVSFYLHQFGVRAGDVIIMPSGLRTPQCVSNFKVDYNFVTNQLIPVRECKTCTGEAAATCTDLL